ncbi:MAG: hypothetical protein K2X91_19560, partial [Thermoleophilia bacterium]|nr:hypothetical protein [Thermoleophilia bacterium]
MVDVDLHHRAILADSEPVAHAVPQSSGPSGVRHTDSCKILLRQPAAGRILRTTDGSSGRKPMAYQSIEVRKLTPGIGAEISGVDLGKP